MNREWLVSVGYYGLVSFEHTPTGNPYGAWALLIPVGSWGSVGVLFLQHSEGIHNFETLSEGGRVRERVTEQVNAHKGQAHGTKDGTTSSFLR